MKQVNEEQRPFDKKQAQHDNIQNSLDGCSKSLEGVLGQLNILTPANDANLDMSITKLMHMQQLLASYLARVGANSVEQTLAQSPFVAQQVDSSPVRLVPLVFNMEQDTGLNTAPVDQLEQSPGKKRKLAAEDNVLPTLLPPTKRPRKSGAQPQSEPKPKSTLALIKLAHNHADVKGMIEDIQEEHVLKRKPKIKVDAEECSNGNIRMIVSTVTMFKTKQPAIRRQQAPVQEDIPNCKPFETRSGRVYGR